MAASDQAHAASQEQTGSRQVGDMINTAAAARILGVTPATLRNYAWLQSLTKRERKQRSLQEPPPGMPRPKRVRGELAWKHQEVVSFREKRQAT
ncbi:hypothetical protein [Duganella sp. LjRoot269]|uniref:hypothetical protein n=1 Tax=Duganella sp. LjRoot269 TaxID=3342305 RepID=UPI003F4FC187